MSRGESGNDFGLEAIDTLVPMMENHRDRLVVILAGYSREMAQFIEANSGIASRIAYKIEFPDYTAQELHLILLSMCQKANRICPDDVQLTSCTMRGQWGGRASQPSFPGSAWEREYRGSASI